MKKLLFVALALFSYAGTGVMAQENNSDADNDRKEKAKEFITKQAERMAKNLKLDDAKTKTFTDLLVEYRTQEMELRMSSAANRRQENRKKRSQRRNGDFSIARRKKRKNLVVRRSLKVLRKRKKVC